MQRLGVCGQLGVLYDTGLATARGIRVTSRSMGEAEAAVRHKGAGAEQQGRSIHDVLYGKGVTAAWGM